MDHSDTTLCRRKRRIIRRVVEKRSREREAYHSHCVLASMRCSMRCVHALRPCVASMRYVYALRPCVASLRCVTAQSGIGSTAHALLLSTSVLHKGMRGVMGGRYGGRRGDDIYLSHR